MMRSSTKFLLVFFSFHALDTVFLCNCKVPCCFDGFKALHTIKLVKFTSSTADMTKLLSNCSALELLILINIKEATGLEIWAPRLKKLIINFCFAYLQLEAPMLMSAKILLKSNLFGGKFSDTQFLAKNEGKSNIEEALDSLVHIEKLKMQEDFSRGDN